MWGWIKKHVRFGRDLENNTEWWPWSQMPPHKTLNPSLPIKPSASYLAFLNFSFLMCKARVMLVASLVIVRHLDLDWFVITINCAGLNTV